MRQYFTTITQQERQCTHNVTEVRVSLTGVAVKIQYVLHILSVCTLALVIQHAQRMRRVMLSSVACLATPYYIMNEIFSRKKNTVKLPNKN